MYKFEDLNWLSVWDGLQTGERLKDVVAGVMEGTMQMVVDPLARSLMRTAPGKSTINSDRYTLLSRSEQYFARDDGQAEQGTGCSARCREEGLKAAEVGGSREGEATNVEHRVQDSWRHVFEKQGRAGAMGMHVM